MFYLKMSSDFTLNANIRITCHSTDNISMKSDRETLLTRRNGQRLVSLESGCLRGRRGLTAGTSVTPPTTLPLQGLQAISAIHAAEV